MKNLQMTFNGFNLTLIPFMDQWYIQNLDNGELDLVENKAYMVELNHCQQDMLGVRLFNGERKIFTPLYDYYLDRFTYNRRIDQLNLEILKSLGINYWLIQYRGIE